MKKSLVTMLIILLMAIPLTVYTVYVAATESETIHVDESSFQCNVTFIITDETAEGYPKSSFTAVMTDKTKTITDSYSFTKGNSWGGTNTPNYTVIAPTTYTVTFKDLADGYTIVNTLDYSSEITFEAASGGIAECHWSIIDVPTNSVNVSKSDSKLLEQAESPTNSGNVSESDSKLLEQAESNSYGVSNEKSKEVYQTFLNAVNYIADNDEWYSALLIQYEMFESRYAGWYAEYVEGGTEEEFLEKSLFDRFVWTETYLRYAWAVNTGEVDTYFGSEKNFESHITSNITNMIENVSNYQTVEDAYLALAKWQYNYVQETGVPYNFINGQSYLDEVKKVKENKQKTKTDEEEISKDASELELLEDTNKITKEEVEEAGIWDDTFDVLSRNFLTIIIIVILCIVVAFFIWKRKSLNIDDNTNGNGNSIDNTHDK